MNRLLPFIVFVFAFVLTASPARADVEVEACIKQHNQCISVCREDGLDTGCVVKCASFEAQCAGGVSLEQTVPFIREAAREIERYLFDFFKEHFPQMIEERRKLFNPNEI